MNKNIWKGKSVLLTGHTGFKGSWLSLCLSELGAELHGLALDPPADEDNLFTIANLSSLLASDNRIDIRNAAQVKQVMKAVKPDIVFHLAAQPLVQYSYDHPLETYAVNVMGTAHVLEAIRYCDFVRAIVVVTSDKCYENKGNVPSYVETDRLGGTDPYSNSKACAEFVAASYRLSYFSQEGQPHLATARAGNVIGGGDWAANRLIPDCIRAYLSQQALTLRYPMAIRPWQHVLEPIWGYILLAEKLLDLEGSRHAEGWNFGPELKDMQSVGQVAKDACARLNVPIDILPCSNQRYEATFLRLNSTKAKECLNWHPKWSLQKTIEETLSWYQHYFQGENMLRYSRDQLNRYMQAESCVAV